MRSFAALSALLLALPASSECIRPFLAATYEATPPAAGAAGPITAYRWWVGDELVAETTANRAEIACGAPVQVQARDGFTRAANVYGPALEGNWSPLSEPAEAASCKTLGLAPGVVMNANHFVKYFVPAYVSGLPICGS